MKISIVIPNYNGADLLKKNIPAVFAAAEYYETKSMDTVEIIIVDDASTDSSDTIVKSFTFPHTYLKHEKNVGFSSNVNRGVEAATGDIMVLLNSDVTPHKDFLVPLLKHFDHENVFGVGCLDISIEGNAEKKRGRGLGKYTRGFLVHRAGDTTKTTTLWVSGGSSAIRKSVFSKLGGFYPIYNPFYWEDIDLSYRAQKAGYTVIFEPKSQVVHEHDAGSIKKQFSSHKITSVAYRNQFLFVWINITETSLLLSHLLWLPVHLLQAVLRLDVRFYQGFIAAVRKIPNVLILRKQNKSFMKRTDSFVINISR